MFSTTMRSRIMTQNNPKSSFLAALLFSVFVFLSTETIAQTKIEVSVNNGVVTSYQITQRSRFLRLTGFKGDSVAEAKKQLITEELQFQEAKRVDINIRPAAIESAFERLAKGNGATKEQFSQALRQRGVNPDTLKQLIRARITWQQYVIARANTVEDKPKVATDITSILFNRNGDGQNRKIKEYTIQQYMFLVSADASKQETQQRLREVEAFRRSHSSCETASENALNLVSSGVVSKSLGRFTSDTLPPKMKDDVNNAGDALFTSPKRRKIGIEIMAICKTREIVDSSATGNLSVENVGKLDSKELEEKSKEWMAELRDTANIRNR